jgi:predicted TIM-barrel fold metal-dependent hydrolase
VSDVSPFPGEACDTHIHVYDAHYPTAATAILCRADASTGDYEDFRRPLG